MTFSAVVHSLIEKGELVPVQGHERWRTGGLGSIASAMLSILWKGVVTASSVLWRSDELHTNVSRFLSVLNLHIQFYIYATSMTQFFTLLFLLICKVMNRVILSFIDIHPSNRNPQL